MSNPYHFGESQYLRKIEFDFEGLPPYIVQKAIIWKFEDSSLRTVDDYNGWKAGLLEFYRTIPDNFVIPALTKGIEFGKKAYQYHLDNECSDKSKCSKNESWSRRIAMAEQLLSQLNDSLKETTNVEIATTTAQETKNPDFTTARQVLAVHYLLEYCKVRNVDNTVKARFIQFLTGKETGASHIKNTTIYKRVAKPLGNDNKTLNADLNFIRTYFESLGLSEIAKMITNEISKSDI
jgi:hypothetical protein